MKYLCLAPLLLLATPAYAECSPTGKLLVELYGMGFSPKIEMAVNHTDVLIFVNESHQYLVVEYKDENTACIVGGGPMLYVLREKKA